jgi:hypothetical protein
MLRHTLPRRIGNCLQSVPLGALAEHAPSAVLVSNGGYSDLS